MNFVFSWVFSKGHKNVWLGSMFLSDFASMEQRYG